MRSWLVAALGFLAACATLLAGLVVFAAFAVCEIGTKIGARVLASTLEGIAVMGALIASAGAFLVLLAALILLQTPPLLAPFGTLGEVVRFGLSVWSGVE